MRQKRFGTSLTALGCVRGRLAEFGSALSVARLAKVSLALNPGGVDCGPAYGTGTNFCTRLPESTSPV